MIGVLFFSAVLLISYAGLRLDIRLLQIVAVVCLIYGSTQYLTSPGDGLMPVYLLLLLSDIAMITAGTFRR